MIKVLGEAGAVPGKTGFREPVPGTGSGNQFWELLDPGFDEIPTEFAVPRFRFRRSRERSCEGSGV